MVDYLIRTLDFSDAKIVSLKVDKLHLCKTLNVLNNHACFIDT